MKHRLALLFSALLAIPAAAQDKPKPIAAHPKVDQEKVDAAIQAGCKYLLAPAAWGPSRTASAISRRPSSPTPS
jgi:hypothetical protein